MTIWVDGDAMPKAIKEIIFRAAIKRSYPLVIVAHHALFPPSSPFIRKIQVPIGPDAADRYIIEHLQEGDLVLTADILLADAAVKAGALCLNPSGSLYTASTIKQALALRNFHTALREEGIFSVQGAGLSAKEIQRFSRHLDSFLQKKSSLR